MARASDPASGDPLGPEEGTVVIPEERTEVRQPRSYRVLFHNDDYTTMEFVVYALISIFDRSTPDATRIMLQVHHDGVGTAGIYPREVAETKVQEVELAAQTHGMPLRVTSEPIES